MATRKRALFRLPFRPFAPKAIHRCLASMAAPVGLESRRQGVGQIYLAKLKAGVPHINQLADACEPRFRGTIDEFRALHAGDAEVSETLRNKVRVCTSCGKACAFTLSSCNSCGRSLDNIPISFSDNVFMGFVYGIGRGKFPYTISLRHQSERHLCFDDPLAMSPCHLNAIPTDVYVPDVRYLFTDPSRGLKLIEDLMDVSCKAAFDQFWSVPAFRQKYFADECPPVDFSGVREFVLGGMNYPPSMYQLHLQFIHPPLLPFHFAQALQDNHFHYRRFFPFEYVRKALALGKRVQMDINDDTSIEDMIEYIEGQGVSYDVEHAALMRRCRRLQQRFAAWSEEDFESRVVGGKVLTDALEPAPRESAQAIQEADGRALQNYGRPCGPDGRPTGTFYRYAKAPGEVPRFAPARGGRSML